MRPPFEARDSEPRGEIIDVLNATLAVVRDGGDDGDLVARLLAHHGETEVLRMLALAQVTGTKLALARSETMRTLKGLPGWRERRCPTCGTVCDECLADAEGDLRDALGNLGNDGD